LFEEDFILLSRADKEKTAFPSSEDDFAPQSALDHLGATSSAWLKRAYGISIEQRIALVEAGYGTTLIPRNWLELDRLPAALTIKPANGRRCFSAVWRQSYALGEALQRMFATH
jgi:LysR family hydrogen peroxide-inducible transcriptional activator